MFTVEPPFYSQNDRVYAPLITRSGTSIPAACYACRLVMVSVAVSRVGITELIFVNPGVKVNGHYYCDVLLSQQMLSAIKLSLIHI